MTQITGSTLPTPTYPAGAVRHLVEDHGWDVPIGEGEAELAHRYAHGGAGRPDLADDVTHTHSAGAGHPQRTSGYAVAALICGLLWFGWVGSVLALIFGYVARRDIRSSQGTLTGSGLASTGIWLGWAAFIVPPMFIVGLALSSRVG